jgi:demethylmenaquinone methyltransferase/2-methoxy-6-polyprenyl-1,4-benzoquinol methylase
MLETEMSDIRDFFDSCAERGVLAEFTPEETVKLDALIEKWEIQKGDRVLEPGCGSGRLTARLAELIGDSGEVLAFDVSPRMIEKARARVLEPPVEWRVGSVYEIPRSDAWFDRVLCFCAFPHFTRPEEALREMSRVLKPGGHFWINHFVGSAIINDFHRKAGTAVENHVLPAFPDMARMLEKSGLKVAEFIDREDLYSLHARKI